MHFSKILTRPTATAWPCWTQSLTAKPLGLVEHLFGKEKGCSNHACVDAFVFAGPERILRHKGPHHIQESNPKACVKLDGMKLYHLWFWHPCCWTYLFIMSLGSRGRIFLVFANILLCTGWRILLFWCWIWLPFGAHVSTFVFIRSSSLFCCILCRCWGQGQRLGRGPWNFYLIFGYTEEGKKGNC